MNKNIEVINENLWAVNFYYVKMNCIKELKLLDENVDDIVKISIDGKTQVINDSSDCCNHEIGRQRVAYETRILQGHENNCS